MSFFSWKKIALLKYLNLSTFDINVSGYEQTFQANFANIACQIVKDFWLSSLPYHLLT